ncbi:MAG: L,D-transpeptidase family protein [Ignavibacteria bacterium]
MQNFFNNKYRPAVLIACLMFLCINSYAAYDNISKYLPADSLISKEISKDLLYFETNDLESSDMIIRDHLTEKFPIISEDAINKIILSKSVENITAASSDSLLTSASENAYKVSFEVPVNYLQDTAKILWQLNIPGFESKIFQLYNGQQIFIDTWPNVVGKLSTKTYTGNFTAYKIRNWPSYKDPEPSKKDLPPTPPGPHNPLGLFVVHYDENSLRYFHGTNQNGLLQNKMRNLSHGCVRNDNDNIAKMKEFIIKRVVKSKDLSAWLNSKRSMIYEFEDIDKFPVLITYKTYDMDKNAIGKYIVLYKDVYNYSNPNNIDAKWDDAGLITLTNRENLMAEYRKKFGYDIPDAALGLIVDYLINNAEEYVKYYVDDLKKKFMLE